MPRDTPSPSRAAPWAAACRAAHQAALAWALVPLALAADTAEAPARPAGGRDEAAAAQSADPFCFDGQARSQERCCGHPPHAGPCEWGALFSHGYCCERNSPCFAWGVLVEGGDVKEPLPARSGLECRHLCQAEPRCRSWSFVLQGFADEAARFSCWLKSTPWAEAVMARGQLSGVVSGSRHCPPGHEEVLHSLRHRRTSDLTQEPLGCVLRPRWDPGDYARVAAEKLLAHGWSVVRETLGAEEANALRGASDRALEELLASDPVRAGNRGPRRYSLGSASRTHHMVHVPEWARLIDNPVITPILRLAFEDSYVAIGGGGDVVLEETDTVQWLHVDLPRWEMYEKLRPPPGIGVNFAVQDVSCQGGAMRLVPNTHTMPFQLEIMAPSAETATLERRGLSRVFVCPLRKGDAVLRDLRLWHAGSANAGSAVRHLPNAEFLSSWYADRTKGTEDHLAPRPAIPADVWRTLTPYAQRLSERARADGPLELGFRTDFTIPQQYD